MAVSLGTRDSDDKHGEGRHWEEFDSRREGLDRHQNGDEAEIYR